MAAVIIDTHILIWDQLDPKRLSARARKAIENADRNDQIILCEVSLWEISILMKKKRLRLDVSYLDFMDQVLQTRNFVLQGITPEIAFLASEIELDTKDPADRIIAATSKALGLPLISADKFMQQSNDIRIIW